MQLDGEVLSILRTTHRNGDSLCPRACSSALLTCDVGFKGLGIRV